MAYTLQESFRAKYLNHKRLRKELEKIYGDGQFKLDASGQNTCLYAPRSLTEAQKSYLEEKCYDRHFVGNASEDKWGKTKSEEGGGSNTSEEKGENKKDKK